MRDAGRPLFSEPAAPRPPAPSLKLPRAGRQALVIPAPVATLPYRLEFKRLLRETERIDRYDALILAQARRFGMDPRLVKAIIAAESDFRTEARSPRGAQGLMQMMPDTAEAMGLPRRSLADPEGNVAAGTAYLRFLFDKAWTRFKLRGVDFSRAPPWVVQRIIAAYNAGPRSMVRAGWRAETRSYVRKVVLFYQSEVADTARSSAPRRPLPETRP